MKRATTLMALIVCAVLLSSVFTLPAAADREKRIPDKLAAKDARKKSARPSERRASELASLFVDQDPPSSKQGKDAQTAKITGKIRTQNAEAEMEGDEEEQDPDLPAGMHGDKEEFFRKRDEFIALLHGVEPGKPFDPLARGRAIQKMERRQTELRQAAQSSEKSDSGVKPDALNAAWVELGPNPIPNGQTAPANPVSGRVTAIEIHPTDPNIVYVGTAMGGVFRSLNGGTTWTAIFDGADSLAIGALALAPSSPTTLYVGTGEANGAIDNYAGVGLYRIDNADTSATLVGPINPNRSYNDAGGPRLVPAFNGRSISKILVLPSDASTVFVGVAGGLIGIGGESPFGNTVPPLSLRGLYKLTFATSPPASVGVLRIGVRSGAGIEGCFDLPCTGNRNVNDMVFDPSDPTGNTIILWLNGTANLAAMPPGLDGGVWRTTNALAATPLFTQTFSTTSLTTSNGRGTLAIYKPSAGPSVVYAASGEDALGTDCDLAVSGTSQRGALRKSIDGGVTWGSKLPGGGGFCDSQCFYNLGLAVQPGVTPATDKLLLGGNVSSANCRRLQATSIDGGTSFTNQNAGLHADTHVIKFAPSDATIVYRGDDGGIWKSLNGGTITVPFPWISLNNSGFKATQFMGISLHPANRDFSFGGTQDNGSIVLKTGPSWNRVDGGDGGFSLIDQNATDTTNVVMYHTYFNLTSNFVGYAESDTAGVPLLSWNVRGCDDGVTPNNGINCTDNVNFYAPLAQGPGNPNTVYYGTDRVYRSGDKGLNNTVVSQAPITAGVPVSSIAISPLDDSYRLVGLNNGALFFTVNGSSTLTSLDPVSGGSVIPDRYIGRVLFDPNVKTTAYIALGGYMGNISGPCVTAACSHVWRVTNLGGSPVLTAINGSGGTGLPDIPINAFAVDPLNVNHLYAGTDIGVYFSADAGASWNPYGTGLPRIAVFGIGIQSSSRTVRIATHGRGMWETPTFQAGVGANIQFSNANYNAGEGDIGIVINVTRTGDTSGTSTIDFATNDGTGAQAARQKSDYEITNGTLTFAPSDTLKTFKVLLEDDSFVEGTETLNLSLSNPTNANLLSPSAATITIADNDTASTTSPVSKQFVANLIGAEETPPTPNVVNGNGGIVQLDAAESSAKVSQIFSGLGSSETAAHIHVGAVGVPGPIIFPLPTTNPVTNFVINPIPSQVAELRAGMHYMNVHSTNFPNGEIRGQLQWNPMEEADLFVRQAYFDFLSRSPDAGGLTFWTTKITDCQSDVQCLRNARIDVSNQFYAEQEFQQTGAVVYRLYRAAYGSNQPFPNPNPDPAFPNEEKTMPAYPVFVADRARLTGSPNLAQSQLDLATLFVQRPEFVAKYPASLSTAVPFVDAVLANLLTFGVTLAAADRNNLITNFGTGGRALVMFHLANDYWNKCAGAPPCLPAGFGLAVDNRPLIDAEYNRAFVLTEYWGYLRRNPDIAGFRFWLTNVNSAPLRDLSQQRRMVCVFATSAEFQNRFGPVASRNNNECQ